MMNNIYDFSEISELRDKQNKLIFQYVIYAICFVLALALACIAIENNILLTAMFAFTLLIFIFFSILFWKVKYRILDDYRKFLDDMETGKQDDYVGVFSGKSSLGSDDEPFSTYTFLSLGKETGFMIHNQHSVCFEKGKKYHIQHVGKYVYQWEIID